MIPYLLRRLALMVPTLLGVSLVVFLFIRLIPGDIIVVLSGARGELSPEQRELLRQDLGLDRPIMVQYVDWLTNALRGDLGTSLRNGREIGPDLASRLPVTGELALLAAIIGATIGLVTGIIAALRRGTWTELTAQGFGLLGLSVPDFWLGTLFLLAASRYFGWYPGARYVSIFDRPLENLSMFILPALAVGIGLSASLMRITRSSLLDVLGAGYVTTARAKGLSSSAVLWRHALKNAMIPIVTVIGLQLGYLLGGVVIIETVFNLPGVGRFTVDAISARDYPVVQATVLLVTVIVLVINLIVDILYAFLDPRIKYGAKSS
jgi:peptide/nickel transport system permease protein